jgi:catechol 2,3-dioxygenase
MPDSGVLPAATNLSDLTLRVRNLPGQVAFYRDLLGLDVLFEDDGSATLGRDGQIITLRSDPHAVLPGAPTTGLYHAAILLPDRRALAAMIARLAQAGYLIQGAADHGVSEAFYLADPERNGIELYRDRPRSDWRFADGQIIMLSDPVDQEGIFATLTPGEPLPGLAPAGTRLGHLHLQVDDLQKARRFYGGVLGFEVLMTTPGALFMAAGGYHHHLGFNTWQTAGAPLPAPHQTGLIGFTIQVPAAGRTALEGRLEHDGVSHHEENGSIRLLDPWLNEVKLAFSAEQD